MNKAKEILLKALANIESHETTMNSELKKAVEVVAGWQLDLKKSADAKKEIQEALSKLEDKNEPAKPASKSKKVK